MLCPSPSVAVLQSSEYPQSVRVRGTARRINHQWRGWVSLSHTEIHNQRRQLLVIHTSESLCPANPRLDAVPPDVRPQSWLNVKEAGVSKRQADLEEGGWEVKVETDGRNCLKRKCLHYLHLKGIQFINIRNLRMHSDDTKIYIS